MAKPKLVLIGASTGGPGHLEKILSALPKEYKNTIIIAQHMDTVFMPSLVKRFDEQIFLDTLIAKDNSLIKTNTVTFADCKFSKLEHSTTKGLFISDSNLNSPYLPSIDSLFNSALNITKHFDILACLLTGIGDDGSSAIVELHKQGTKCIIEDESSCIVYGMPRVAHELDNSLEQLRLEDIIQKIKDF